MNASCAQFLFESHCLERIVDPLDNPVMTKTPDTAVGQVIADKLKKMGKPRQWLAEQTGVSNGAVTHWIKTGQIGRDSALAVAMALEISVDELYGKTAAVEEQGQQFTLEWVSLEEMQLLTNFRQCTPTGQEMIRITARGAPKDAARAAPAKAA